MSGPNDTKEKSMRTLWNRVSIGWCRMFHPDPSWPIHGHYHCPACMRLYPVPWHEGDDVVPHAAHPGFVVFEFQKNRG